MFPKDIFQAVYRETYPLFQVICLTLKIEVEVYPISKIVGEIDFINLTFIPLFVI